MFKKLSTQSWCARMRSSIFSKRKKSVHHLFIWVWCLITDKKKALRTELTAVVWPVLSVEFVLRVLWWTPDVGSWSYSMINFFHCSWFGFPTTCTVYRFQSDARMRQTLGAEQIIGWWFCCFVRDGLSDCSSGSEELVIDWDGLEEVEF